MDTGTMDIMHTGTMDITGIIKRYLTCLLKFWILPSLYPFSAVHADTVALSEIKLPFISVYEPDIKTISMRYRSDFNACSISASLMSCISGEKFYILMNEMKQCPDFYTEEFKPVIAEQKKIDSLCLETVLCDLKENPNRENLYKLASYMLLDSDSSYPSVWKFKYDENKSCIRDKYWDTRENADFQLNKFINLFEQIYEPVMTDIIFCQNIRAKIEAHKKRIALVTQFFEICAQPVTKSKVKNISPEKELEVKKKLENSLLKKDEESIKFIVKYKKFFNREMEQMISIASNELNPHKWRKRL